MQIKGSETKGAYKLSKDSELHSHPWECGYCKILDDDCTAPLHDSIHQSPTAVTSGSVAVLSLKCLLCKYLSVSVFPWMLFCLWWVHGYSCICYWLYHIVFLREYRNSIEFRPLRESDPVEDHQITVCIRKRPLNKKGKSKHLLVHMFVIQLQCFSIVCLGLVVHIIIS
jgi:hypothetical protein